MTVRRPLVLLTAPERFHACFDRAGEIEHLPLVAVTLRGAFAGAGTALGKVDPHALQVGSSLECVALGISAIC